MPHDVSATTEYTLRDQELMQAARRYFAWQARIVCRELGRRVVEVGCGVGNFTRHLLDRELVVSIDTEAECVAQLLRKLNNPPNVLAKHLDVLDPAFVELRRHAADSIICLNVLEHVRDDQLALRNMAAILPPGGKAIFLLPAFEALYGKIDHNLGHFRRYSKKYIRQVAALSGFEIHRVRYMNSIGCIGWWVNAKIWKRTAQSEQQIRVFDRFLVPLLERVEGCIPPPFGQSLFVVLTRKP